VTEEDREDARALLGFLAGFGADRRAALDEGRPHDHTGPGYDPNRMVRILTALREILPEEIENWKYHRLSRAAAEKLWEEHLFSRHCSTCEKRCHGCLALAGALGYEPAEHANGTRTWRRPEKEAR
jgi:hypothetical protein